MILLFSIFNKDYREIFQKFFVEKSYFSKVQINTIINSITRLLNIVESSSKNERKVFQEQIFNITNLLVHVIKYKSFFFLFVTPTLFRNSNKPINIENEYFSLIKKIDDLIVQCSSREPNFDLIQNDYFKQKTEIYIGHLNKFLVKMLNKDENKESIEENKQIKSYYKKSFGKYLIVGSGNAGKSSIIAQFISNWDQDELKNIKPTINKETHNFKDNLTTHNFNLVDLGGQVQYTELHLNDPNLFSNVHALIYVIDVQDTKKIDFTKNYLLDILDRAVNDNEKPYVALFLHKNDPKIQDSLGQNIQNWIEWIDQNLSKFNIEYSYFLTSIKDDSAKEAFARTLLFTLPYWFLALTIKEDLIIRSLNSLYPIISELKINKNSEDHEIIEKELFQESILFGFAATKIVINKWIKHLLSNKNELEIPINSETNRATSDQLIIKFSPKEALLNMQIKCPLLLNNEFDEINNFSSVCEITNGIITGLSQFIGLGTVSMIETQIRNKSEYCKFNISI